MSFDGTGKSKKDAKLNASKALLVHLHKVGFDPMTGEMMSTQQNNNDIAIGHSLADKIGQIVHAKYQVTTAFIHFKIRSQNYNKRSLDTQALFGTTTYSKRKVMAGVVMTMGEDNFEVVCVSSGTKCINGEKLSLEGCVINDCHAEIVARRALLLFFYKHLSLLLNSPTPEVQEDNAEDDKITTEGDEDKVAKNVGLKESIFHPEPVDGKYRFVS